MKNILQIFILNLVALFSLSAIANNKKVVLAADYWCPYNCTPGSDKEGLLIDIARIAFAKKGIEVEYKLTPWVTAVDDFNKGRIDGIVGTVYGEVESPIYPSIEQATINISAFTLDNTTWVYDGPESLNNKTLAIVEGYEYEKDIKSYIYSNYISKPNNFLFSTAENPVEDCVNRLLKEQIFVYLETEAVVNYYAKENNITNLRNAGNTLAKPYQIFIAFPRSNPNAEEYANLITDATFALKANGKMAQLYKKYGMKSGMKNTK